MVKWFFLMMGLSATPSSFASDDPNPTHATTFPQAALRRGDPLADAEAKRQERQKAVEAAQSKKPARVVVLQWKDKPVDYTNGTVERVVKMRIARPKAKFFPDVDLYQEGRKKKGDNVSVADQLGVVPADAIAAVNSAVAEVEKIPWDKISESEWGGQANSLREVADKVWFLERPDLRESVFKLYVQIGRAAENQNNPSPPFYEQIGGKTVNYYWYMAGAMAHQEPALMKKLKDPDLSGSIDYYKSMLDSKQIKPMTLSFENQGDFDAAKFAGDYQVFINGLEVTIDSSDGLKQVPPGRVDVYLKHSDGSHSISDTIDITKLEGKIYFVRDVARKKMGIDFIDQLMKHPNECTPKLDSEIITYLSIYANLHPDAEVYIAVPEAGLANRILLWRWDRDTSMLQKVLDNSGGFPVRFALLGQVGMAFNGASLEASDPTLTAPPTASVTPAPAMVPFEFQLRGHLGRLMVVTGAQFGLNITDEKKWTDTYTPSGAADNVTVSRPVNRLVYGGVGMMFMKDAAKGMGPYGYAQFGTYDLPHSLDLSLHGGFTKQGPLGGDGRVRSLLNAELFGGVMQPYRQSRLPEATLNFGLKAGVGLTF